MKPLITFLIVLPWLLVGCVYVAGCVACLPLLPLMALSERLQGRRVGRPFCHPFHYRWSDV
jgi:hypothetical protein